METKSITPTYVTLAQAKLLKKKNFNVSTLNWYHKGTKKLNRNDLLCSMNKLTDNYSAPEQWQVIEWFELVFKIYIDTKCVNSTRGDNFEYCIHKNNDTIKIKNGFNNRKEACSAAIDYILTVLLEADNL